MTVGNKSKQYEPLISQYIEVTERLKLGNYDLEVPVHSADSELNRLGLALQSLA